MKEGEIVGSYGTMHYVLNMDQTLDFYRKNIGFEEINASPGWSEIILTGGHRLCFHPTDDKELVEKGGILIMNVRNLRGIVEGLKERGVQILSDVKEVYDGAYVAEFVDSDGHVISLHEGTC